MSDSRQESALSRWSRRKLAAREEQQGEKTEDALEIEPSAEGQDIQSPETVEPEIPALTDADMPDIETLTEESDYSPFMSPGVSEELRKLALRKMFRASVFNVRDGLDEYDDDFTSFEKLGDIVTSDMKHRIEMEKQKLREKLEAEEAFDEDAMEVIDDDEVDAQDDEESVEALSEAANEGESHSPDDDPEEDMNERS